MAAKKSGSGSSPDLATIGGILLALGGILGGLLLEGGKLQDVAQITAAIIVIGGTLGAVMVSTPLRVLKGALSRFGKVLFDSNPPTDALIEELIDYASTARKHGLVSLEQRSLQIVDPFLRKAMNLAVDGTDMQELRSMMELETEMEECRALAEAKVLENAGGYAPTIGIIGAVMGLIQVMKNLANIEEVGHGIAVAFVATVYGVGLANIVFLPASNKIRAQIQRQTELRELMLEGVISIVEGLNPKLIRSKLEAYREPVRVKSPASRQAKEGEVRRAATAES